MATIQHQAFVRRLTDAWRTADAETRTVGRKWYADARAMCKRLAANHGVTERTAAGVVAALSPRLQWTYNVIAADLTLATSDGHRVPGVFRASLAKARRIQAGERPLAVLSGPKVRAFYMALIGDSDAAVVDVWVARAVGINDAPTARQYEAVARALADAAALCGETVPAFQATVWVVTRGRA